MRKKELPVSHIAEAQEWANTLIRRESRGPGDLPNAMRRLEARYGIPWRTFWSLRYRPPEDILTGIYFRLHQAFQLECQRQKRLIEHEIKMAEAAGLPVADIAAKTRALVADEEGWD